MTITDHYLQWNQALGEHFFSPERAGERVILYVTEDVLESLATESELDVASFVDTVKSGAPWSTGRGLCQSALAALTDWRQRDLPEPAYPPYLCYLALFVLAVGVDAPDLQTFAYYPRLNRLLGESDSRSVASFELMYKLWEDLEVWSTRDKQGEFGTFELMIAGEQLHVGLPRAQTLLTESERDALSGVFSDAQLDPASDPPDAELLRALSRYGDGRGLRPRTIELARGSSEDELREALAEVVGEELAVWDGVGSDPASTQALIGGMRIALSVDPVSGSVEASLRCALRSDATIPEEGIQLTCDRLGLRVSCREHVAGWSTRLVDENTVIFDAAQIDWRQPLVFASELGLDVRFPGREVRIFALGARMGLPGYQEVGKLPQDSESEFLLAGSGKKGEVLEAWAHGACGTFTEVRARSGLPEGWRVWRAGSLKDSYEPPPFPSLAVNSALRLRLRGGLRSGSGNQFFAFALPSVESLGATDAVVRAEGAKLVAMGAGTYEINSISEPDTTITLEASSASRVRRATLVTAGSFAWKAPRGADCSLDCFGERKTSHGGVGVAGAQLLNRETDSDFLPDPTSGLPNGPGAFQSLTLLGCRPGEIQQWDREHPSCEWPAVWALAKRSRKIDVFYVGQSLSRDVPGEPDPTLQLQWSAWKDAFVRNRRRSKVQGGQAIHKLWATYTEVARNGQ